MLLIKVELPNGQIESHRVSHYPFRIGRGEDNALILANTSVSSHHAELIESHGEIFLIEKKSTNKLIVEGSIYTRIKVEEGLNVKIGDVIITFEIDESELDKTRPIDLRPFQKIIQTKNKEQLKWLGLNFFAFLALSFIIDRLFNYNFEVKEYFSDLPVTIIFFGGISMLVATVAKLFTGRFVYLPSLNFLIFSGSMFLLIEYIDHFLNFHLSASLGTFFAETISYLILFAYGTFFLSTLIKIVINNVSNKTVLISSSVGLLMMLSTFALVEELKNKTNYDFATSVVPTYYALTKPEKTVKKLENLFQESKLFIIKDRKEMLEKRQENFQDEPRGKGKIDQFEIEEIETSKVAPVDNSTTRN